MKSWTLGPAGARVMYSSLIVGLLRWPRASVKGWEAGQPRPTYMMSYSEVSADAWTTCAHVLLALLDVLHASVRRLARAFPQLFSTCARVDSTRAFLAHVALALVSAASIDASLPGARGPFLVAQVEL